MASQSHVHITHCAKLTKTYLLQDTESHGTFMTTGEGQVQLLYTVVVDWWIMYIFNISRQGHKSSRRTIARLIPQHNRTEHCGGMDLAKLAVIVSLISVKLGKSI